MRVTALFLMLLLAGCSKEFESPVSPTATAVVSLDKKKPPTPPTPQPATLSLSARSWQDPLDTNVPLSNDSSGALQFTIPPVGHSVNYLITSGPRAPLGTVTATMRIDASPDAVVVANECGNPRWRILLMAHGTNWSDPDARWWSNPASAAVTGGAATVSAPLDPSQWSNVNGQVGSSRPTEFAAAMRDISHYGVTFGGCFFGHGIFMQSGTATAHITSFQVVP